MILNVFKNGAFPLTKQYQSGDIENWKEDEMDSVIIPEKTDDLLPSVKRKKKRKTEKEKVFKKVVKGKYDTYNNLDELLYKAEKYLEPHFIQKHFSFNTLGDTLGCLFKTKDIYKNETRISLIKNGLRDLKNEIKQMPKMEIIDKRPDVIVSLVEEILDANER